MKRIFAITALMLLLLTGCGKKSAAPENTEPSVPAITVDSGAGEAVVPEDGDIVIPIGE